jgi:hypothetical protein
MQGDTSRPVESAFPFDVPPPSVSPDLVINLLDEYARTRDSKQISIPEKSLQVLFLGSKPVIKKGNKGIKLWWRWHVNEYQLKIETQLSTAAENEAHAIADLLEDSSCGKGIPAAVFYEKLKKAFGEVTSPKAIKTDKAWKILRSGGLAAF